MSRERGWGVHRGRMGKLVVFLTQADFESIESVASFGNHPVFTVRVGVQSAASSAIPK